MQKIIQRETIPMRNFKEEYQRWLDSPALSEAEWQELKAIENDEKEIEARFFEPLSFGTAGLRGTLATGLRNMNIHVVRHATQAFANVIKAEGEEAVARGISIAYDCRINSDVFAREAACVMAARSAPAAASAASNAFSMRSRSRSRSSVAMRGSLSIRT